MLGLTAYEAKRWCLHPFDFPNDQPIQYQAREAIGYLVFVKKIDLYTNKVQPWGFSHQLYALGQIAFLRSQLKVKSPDGRQMWVGVDVLPYDPLVSSVKERDELIAARLAELNDSVDVVE